MSRHYVYKKPWVRGAIRAYDIATRIRQKRPPKAVTPPDHICFVILHQIGDVVMTLPTVEAICAMQPHAKVSFVVGQGPAQLLADNSWNGTVHPFAANWQKVVRQLQYDANQSAPRQQFLDLLRTLNPDCCVIFHPDLTVNQLMGKTKIPHSFGFTNAGGKWGLTHPVDMPHEGHQVERNFRLAQAFHQTFGGTLPSLRPPHLTPSRTDTQGIRAILKQHACDPQKAVVLHPFASAPTKNWLPESWQTVVAWLHTHNWQPIVIGGPQDTLPFEDTKTLSLCGALSLGETAALLAEVPLFIGIDSGPGHIAAAVGCPIISIFSSVNDPTRWAPYGPESRVRILHKAVTDRQAYPYEMRELPADTKGNPYSDTITPDKVITTVQELLS